MNKKIITRKDFHFERDVIDVILNLIKDNQLYLTKPENLPQLAKLGYIYNTLYYAGRLCWGYNGLIQKSNYDEENGIDYSSCEDNPKYKIEMCKPENNQIEDLIYDAWGMHVSNECTTPTFKKFCQIIIEGEEISELEKLFNKSNKTFDEWCQILMDKKYPYNSLFLTKRNVVNYLLFSIGTGYGYDKKTGCVFTKASGANQDITIYGDWKNADFRKDINKIILKLLKMPEVKNTIDITHMYEYKIKKEQRAKIDAEDKKNASKLGLTLKQWKSKNRYEILSKVLEELEKENNINSEQTTDEDNIEPYHPYYPLCEYSIITQFDQNTHPSYIQAGIGACEEIVTHPKEERKENVEFANKFLKIWKK